MVEKNFTCNTVRFYSLLVLCNYPVTFSPISVNGSEKKTNPRMLPYLLFDALYRVTLTIIQSSVLSNSLPIILFLTSVSLQTYLLTNHFSHFSALSGKQKLTLFFQMTVPSSLSFLGGSLIVYFMYPAYNKQGEEGKLSIALFSPLTGVVVKVLS